jgi:hypothetical protein
MGGVSFQWADSIYIFFCAGMVWFILHEFCSGDQLMTEPADILDAPFRRQGAGLLESQDP